MPIFSSKSNIEKAVERAGKERTDARKHERTIQDLRKALESELQKPSGPAAAPFVIQALVILAQLYMEVQPRQVSNTLAALNKLRTLSEGETASENEVLEFLRSPRTPALEEKEVLALAQHLAQSPQKKVIASDAVNVLQPLVYRYRRNAELVEWVGDFQAESGRPADAARSYQAAAERMGTPHGEDGQRILRKLELLVPHSPEPGLIHRIIGQVAMQSGDYVQAVSHLNQALAQGLRDSETLLALFDGYLAQKDLPQAARMLEQMVEIKTDPTLMITRSSLLLSQVPHEQSALYYQAQRIEGDILRLQNRLPDALAAYRQGLVQVAFPPDLPGRIFAEEVLKRVEEGGAGAERHLNRARALTLLSQPEAAVEAVRTAVREDPTSLNQVLVELTFLTDFHPNCAEAFLEKALLLTQNDRPDESLDLLEDIWRRHPRYGAQVIQVVESLIHRVDHTRRLGGDVYRQVRRRALTLLLRAQAARTEPAAFKTAQALLDGYAQQAAHSVLDALRASRLADLDSLAFALLEGDAEAAAGSTTAALAAYRRAPVREDTVDTVLKHINQLSSQVPSQPGAPVLAADLCLAVGRAGPAVGYLSDAFQRDPDDARTAVVERLAQLHQDNQCPPEGIKLLVAALLYRPSDQSLAAAGSLLAECAADDSCDPAWTADQSRAVRLLSEPGSPLAYQTAWLEVQIRQRLDQPEQAAQDCLPLIHHPHADRAALLPFVEQLTQQPSAPAPAWFGLGELYQMEDQQPSPRSLNAYTQALEKEPAAFAAAVLDRLNEAQAAEPDQMLLALTQARALACLDQPADAVTTLRRILDQWGADAAAPVLALCQMLPQDAQTWLVLARAEAARSNLTAAAGFARQAEQTGQPEVLSELVEWLPGLLALPGAPGDLALVYADALTGSGDQPTASRVLSQIVYQYPGLRAQAIKRLEELESAQRTPDIAFHHAEAQTASGDLPGAITTLSAIWSEPDWRTPAHRLLLSEYDPQVGPDELSGALIQIETGAGDPSWLKQALEHASDWLHREPRPGPAQLAAWDSLTTAADGPAPREETQPLWLAARQGWIEARLRAGLYADAAQSFETLLDRRPDQVDWTCTRAAKALEGQPDAFPLRLALIHALIQDGQVEHALEYCRETPAGALTGQDWTALDAACQQMSAAEPTPPRGVLAQVEAHWVEVLACLRDLDGMIEHAAQAALLDEDIRPSQAMRLTNLGWDAASRRTLRYAGANLLREGGAELYELALRLYEQITEEDFAGQVEQVLDELERFPDSCWPCWDLKYRLWTARGAQGQTDALAALPRAQAASSADRLADLLAFVEQLDPQSPEVHRARSELYERAGQLDQSGQALVDMQAALPGELEQVNQAFTGLLERCPQAWNARLDWGRALFNAGLPDEAVEQFWQVQQAQPDWAGRLLPWYEQALEQIPGSPALHWAMAQAAWTLNLPDPAAASLDRWTDLVEDGEPARRMLSDIIAVHPGCGYAWYGLGKLAYRASDSDGAILRLESARERGVPEAVQVLLYSMLGRSYAAVNQLDLALERLRAAVALSPDQIDLRESLLDVRLAILDTEISEQERRIQAGQADQEAALRLADLLIQQGQPERGVLNLQGLLASAAHPGPLQAGLARCFMAQQRFDLAAAVLEAALSGGGLEPGQRLQVMYHLAQSYHRLLRYDAAVAVLRQIQAVDFEYACAGSLIEQIEREKALALHQPVFIEMAPPVPTRTRKAG